MRKLPWIALVFALAVLVTWPGPFGEQALGHPSGDMPDHLWGTWWFARELLTGHLPLRTTLTHLPDGGALWHPDPLGALLATPLQAFGPVRAWNALLLLQTFAAGLVAWFMGREVSGSALGGLASAVAVSASPYLLGLMHSGLSEYTGLFAPTLFLWTLIRAWRGRSPAWLPGLALAICTWQAFSYGVFGGLLALSLCLHPQWRDRLRVLAVALGVWALLALPVMAIAWTTLTDPDPAFTAAQAPGWSFHSLPATDLHSWLRPGDWVHPDTPALGNPGILHVNYLGWSTLLLAGVGLWRRPELRAELGRGGAAFALISLGPVLSWNRAVPRLGAIPLLLPFALLYLPGSPFHFVHHPYRIAAFLVPLLALFAAAGISALPRVVQALAPLLLLGELLLASAAPWPLLTAPVSAPSVLYAEGVPTEGAILDLPPDASTANRAYLLAQTVHGRTIAYGVNSFVPEQLLVDPLVNEAVLALDDPEARARNRDVPAFDFVVPSPAPGASRLGDWGVSVVLLHTDRCGAEEAERLEALLRRRLGEPVAERDGVLAFEVAQVPIR